MTLLLTGKKGNPKLNWVNYFRKFSTCTKKCNSKLHEWGSRGSQRVPEGPRGSQGDPEEELRSVFKGKVARNNYLKNDFFQFLP